MIPVVAPVGAVRVALPTNGTDGWDLVSFDWSESDGTARFRYERTVEGVHEHRLVHRMQPTRPSHEGWSAAADEVVRHRRRRG